MAEKDEPVKRKKSDVPNALAGRTIVDPWPLGIDQHKAQEILQKAFPQRRPSR